jgi:hypothetical protein
MSSPEAYRMSNLLLEPNAQASRRAGQRDSELG